MAQKRSRSLPLGKAVESIENWLEDEEEEDNLHELYGELDTDEDSEEDLNTTQVDEDEDQPIIRKRIYVKKKLTKSRLVNSIGKIYIYKFK